MSEYALSVVQLCPDSHKYIANALAEEAGYGSNNLSVKLLQEDNSIWWGCHAWWIPEVYYATPIPEFVISSASVEASGYEHWIGVLDSLGLHPEIMIEEL